MVFIYLCWKVFDLTPALGGGLNMGNNMVGGLRNTMRDLEKSQGGSQGGVPSTINQIAQGNAGGGSAMGAQRAARTNSTFTGMALHSVSSHRRYWLNRQSSRSQHRFDRFVWRRPSRSVGWPLCLQPPVTNQEPREQCGLIAFNKEAT